MFAVRGANEGPAGDRSFSHVFREGARIAGLREEDKSPAARIAIDGSIRPYCGQCSSSIA
jgi:hypothetical protein